MIRPVLACALGLVLMAGCTTAPRSLGDIHIQGSVSTFDYYAETKVEKDGRVRYVILLDPASVQAWHGGAHELPLSKTYIGKGPDRSTVLVEQIKDPGQSVIITRRLLRTFNARHGTAIPLP